MISMDVVGKKVSEEGDVSELFGKVSSVEDMSQLLGKLTMSPGAGHLSDGTVSICLGQSDV